METSSVGTREIERTVTAMMEVGEEEMIIAPLVNLLQDEVVIDSRTHTALIAVITMGTTAATDVHDLHRIMEDATRVVIDSEALVHTVISNLKRSLISRDVTGLMSPTFNSSCCMKYRGISSVGLRALLLPPA